MIHRNRKYKWLLLLGILLLILTSLIEDCSCITANDSRINSENNKVEHPTIPESELFAKSAVLMDGITGRILYGKSPDIPMANASTTKILTCIIALEQANLQAVCTASDRACRQPKVHLGVPAGTEILMEHLLYSMMLESHNDSSVMVAEQVSGSLEEFSKEMNEKAKEIGCTDSYFITPNGLDDVDTTGKHHTTATDLSLIMRYCILQSPMREKFMEICQTPSYDFSDVSGRYQFHCSNHNAMLTMTSGVLAGKTGFTGDAGYCYTCGVESEGRYYIISLLACGWPNNRTYKWKDTTRLLEYGKTNYRNQEISYSKLVPIPAVLLKNWGNLSYALADDRNLYPVTQENKETLLLADWEQVRVQYDLPTQIIAPIHRNQIAGYRNVLIDGKPFRQQEMVYEDDYPARDLSWYYRSILRSWMCGN